MFPVERNAAKTVPLSPTKTPEQSASKRFNEDALRPWTEASESVITANEVLEMARPIPSPEKIQPTPTKPNHKPGQIPTVATIDTPTATDRHPYVINRSRRILSQGRDCNQEPVVHPIEPTVSTAPASTNAILRCSTNMSGMKASLPK